MEAPDNGVATIEIDVPLEFKTDAGVITWLQRNRTPLDMVETREGRASHLYYYVRHQYVVETLNRLCRYSWNFRVLREWIHEADDQVTVLGELTVRVAGQEIVKQQYGSGDIERFGKDHRQAGRALSIGDNFKGATSDSLKKCASLIGLGLDLSLPIQKQTMTKLHTVGSTKASSAEEWKKKRKFAIRVLTGGRTESSKELLDIEARILTSIIEGDLSADVVKEAAAKLK